VIWNEDHAVTGNFFTTRSWDSSPRAPKPADRSAGRHFLRSSEQIAEEDRILIQTVARAVITDSLGSLATR